MPAKKYNTQEERNEGYRASSKKYYYAKKGISLEQIKFKKEMKRFVKELLKNDEQNYKKIYDFFKKNQE